MTDCICVNTLSELATTTIPTGTQAAAVNQFNSASAVSSALYILVASNPGHPLSIQAPGGSAAPWWIIHPDHITLEAAGAPPPGGDCAPALKNVLFYYQVVGQVVLKLLERDYVLNSLSAVITEYAPARGSFAIVGQGPMLSRLIVPYPTNVEGALSVSFVDAYSHYWLRNFSVLATGATGQTSGCGTAIAMTFSNNFTPDDGHCGTLEHVRVGPLFDSNGNGWSYFVSGVDLSGTPMPFLFDVKIAGCGGLIAKDNYTDTSPRYYAQTLLTIDNCYDPRIVASIFWHATTAISYVCDFSQVQSFTIADAEIEGVQTGVYTRHVSECPDGQIRNTFCQFRNIGFDLGNIRRWRALDNTMRIEGSEAAAYDIRLIAANTVLIGLHNFEAGDPDSTTVGRINIFIDAETQSNGVAHGENVLVETNIFGEQPTDPFATSAIVATVSAKNIQVGATNAFNGGFTDAVVNDASGTAVTQLGYQTSSTAAAGTVVPNSANGNPQPPTLGSANVPWPITFNYLHTIPISNTEPPAPASGCVLYTIKVGPVIELWEKSSDGSTKQLAP